VLMIDGCSIAGAAPSHCLPLVWLSPMGARRNEVG
jgi:hypothetical protein